MADAAKREKRAAQLEGEAKEFDKADTAEKKHGGRIGRKEGGPVMGLHARGMAVGAGGGLGRLAKIKKYGK